MAKGEEGQGQHRPCYTSEMEEVQHRGPKGDVVSDGAAVPALRRCWGAAGQHSGDGLTDSCWDGGGEAGEGADEIKWEGAPFSGLKEHALRLRETSQPERR